MPNSAMEKYIQAELWKDLDIMTLIFYKLDMYDEINDKILYLAGIKVNLISEQIW